jgi:hypothetical protein
MALQQRRYMDVEGRARGKTERKQMPQTVIVDGAEKPQAMLKPLICCVKHRLGNPDSSLVRPPHVLSSFARTLWALHPNTQQQMLPNIKSSTPCQSDMANSFSEDAAAVDG